MNTTDMNQGMPLTGSVLRWARETSGLSKEDVAHKLKRKTITAETIEAWERGEGAPTYAQLESLAYDVYKRPLALFFFPAPPEEKTPRQAFRTLPDQEIQKISPRLRYLLRRAQARQINLAELSEDILSPSRQLLRDIRVDAGTPATEIAKRVREYLEISLDVQAKWKNADEAFKHWRDALEGCGVFIFKEAFKDETVSGFCLFDERFPVIYVNNSRPDTRQIFTLFHELAHLLSRTGGIDKPIDSYIQYLQGYDRQIEVLCNQFAAEFLVPDADFDQRLKLLPSVREQSIEELARQYHVSREVILRKLLDRKRISQLEYELKVEEWNRPLKNAGDTKNGGGDYYLTQGVYLSKRYLELAFSQLYQNKITIEQLADYLGVKTKFVPKFETSLLQQGVMA
jgi:Zn-dependent peptidase ImmA (M78 family)/DNA-binding transcriptional regulator YiaG